jgi:hypothetical protein
VATNKSCTFPLVIAGTVPGAGVTLDPEVPAVLPARIGVEASAPVIWVIVRVLPVMEAPQSPETVMDDGEAGAIAHATRQRFVELNVPPELVTNVHVRPAVSVMVGAAGALPPWP